MLEKIFFCETWKRLQVLILIQIDFLSSSSSDKQQSKKDKRVKPTPNNTRKKFEPKCLGQKRKSGTSEISEFHHGLSHQLIFATHLVTLVGTLTQFMLIS